MEPALLLATFRSLLRDARDFLVLLDESYRVLAAGAGFVGAILPGGNLRGRCFLSLLDAGSREKARAFLGTPHRHESPVELNHLAADGSVRMASYTFCPFVTPDGSSYVAAIGRDQEDALRMVERVVALNQDLEVARAELERQALTDPLTGLGNRRWLFDRMVALWAAAARRGELVWVALADLDHFKRINDTHGHNVGDAALVAASRAFRGSLRAFDLVARYGGEEFALAGPCRERAEIPALTERLLQAVRVIRVEVPGGTVRLTTSLGVAVVEPGSETSPWPVFKAADLAVYRAKAAGRDRCEVEYGRVERLLCGMAGVSPLGEAQGLAS